MDGAFGAFAALAPSLRAIVAGMDAGRLARGGPAQVGLPAVRGRAGAGARRSGLTAPRSRPGRATSTRPRAASSPAGLPFAELGVQLSRGFRALKVWMSLKTHGARRAGPAGRAERPARRATSATWCEAEPRLELLAPVPLNVVCFRFAAPGLDAAALDAREPGDPHPAPGAGHRGAVEHGAGRAVRAARGDHQPPEQARRLRPAGGRGGGDRGGAHRRTLWREPSDMRIETLAVHAGREPDSATGAVSPPIYLSTTFARGEDHSLPAGYPLRPAGQSQPRARSSRARLTGGGAVALTFPRAAWRPARPSSSRSRRGIT